MRADAMIQTLLRPGRSGALEVRRDVLWLLGIGLLLMATGLGLRDPWPADEPRFALIARDMVRSGQWLIPMVGGDTYADKPPLFFWLIALTFKLTGSLRIAFLLPSLFAGLGTVVLIYDLSRRLWDRETGLAAGLVLLFTVQFVWQGRQAQIDASLCFWTTLGLYGLLRHLLLGPDWRWYAIGWAAAGFGVISKGVGFLPLLVLLPYFLLRQPGWAPRPEIVWGWRWLWGPAAFVAATAVWLAPMLLAATRIPALAAYRDEILFHQTVDRYANAWHHVEPFWYFLVSVIPPLWLPLSALLPWTAPRWWRAWRARDLRVALLVSWIVLVVLFFSSSAGKRGVYVLPAVPALAAVSSPYLKELLLKIGPRRVFWTLAGLIVAVCLLAAGYMFAAPAKRSEVLLAYGIDPPWPLLAIGISGLVLCFWLRVRHSAAAYGAIIAIALLVVGVWINPVLNSARSSASFVRKVETLARDIPELGLVEYKEQYLLEFTRPTFNFGHARWREWELEANDAAAWLSAKPGRALLVEELVRQRCFAQADAISVGDANDADWFIVSGAADAECAAKGHLTAARRYQSAD